MSYQIALQPEDGDVVVVTRSAIQALQLLRRYVRDSPADVAITTLAGEQLTVAELERRALSDDESLLARA